jgi:hypothetical protein
MNSPARKKKKTELSDIDKASMVKSLLEIREDNERKHLYRPALKEFSRLSGYSENTIIKWMKPSERVLIFNKAEKSEKIIESGERLKDMFLSAMSVESSKTSLSLGKICLKKYDEDR